MFKIYYDKSEQKYKMSTDDISFDILATFKIFDMAYDYITRMNHANNQQAVYSRWATR